MTIIEYATEEVRRQGHDVTRVDGLSRVAWMLDAWCYAWVSALGDNRPTYDDAIQIGMLVERLKNLKGIRLCGVRVGTRICPSPSELPRLLYRLFQRRDDMSPLEFYREFEMIHPFVDGNGRTGKILLNWLNGTLEAPIFPPNDFWGNRIVNP